MLGPNLLYPMCPGRAAVSAFKGPPAENSEFSPQLTGAGREGKSKRGG